MGRWWSICAGDALSLTGVHYLRLQAAAKAAAAAEAASAARAAHEEACSTYTDLDALADDAQVPTPTPAPPA